VKEFFDDGENVADMAKPINDFHHKRCCNLLKDTGGTIVIGNANAPEDGNLRPTVIDNPSVDAPVMKEEIFGPILPVFTFSKIDEAIAFINERDKPLVIYYFGKVLLNANKDLLIKKTSSGGFCMNDTLFHLLNSDLPFGGVGASGYGRYHGFEGFK